MTLVVFTVVIIQLAVLANISGRTLTSETHTSLSLTSSGGTQMSSQGADLLVALGGQNALGVVLTRVQLWSTEVPLLFTQLP